MTDILADERSQWALTLLKGARQRNVAWREIVSAIESLEKTSLVDPSGRPWIKICSELSGYSTNHLRRMGKSKSFLADTRLLNYEINMDDLCNLPFAHLESIARIFNFDESAGVEAINNAIGSKVNHRQLLAVINKVKHNTNKGVSNISAGKHSAALFRASCAELVAKIFIERYGKILRKRPVESIYASADYIIINSGDCALQSVVAIDMYDFRSMNYADVVKLKLVPAASKATFFDEFWIVYSGDTDLSVRRTIDKLFVPNVGFIQIDDGLKKIVCVEYPSGQPVPNRTELWKRSVPRSLKP
ncbi:hypothetical protein ACLBYM_36560 [Methylobacterium fujisawaense]